MTKAINITIENKLISEKRDMNVYHHSNRSAHMISHGSCVTLPLKRVSEDDYLFVTIVSGPGKLKQESVVVLPPWLDFEFLSDGKIAVVHADNRTLLKIPPGRPGWQLKLTRFSNTTINGPHYVIIGENAA